MPAGGTSRIELLAGELDEVARIEVRRLERPVLARQLHDQRVAQAGHPVHEHALWKNDTDGSFIIASEHRDKAGRATEKVYKPGTAK